MGAGGSCDGVICHRDFGFKFGTVLSLNFFIKLNIEKFQSPQT
jgi:hypothetical protein